MRGRKTSSRTLDSLDIAASIAEADGLPYRASRQNGASAAPAAGGCIGEPTLTSHQRSKRTTCVLSRWRQTPAAVEAQAKDSSFGNLGLW